MSRENVAIVGSLLALWGRATWLRALRDDWAWPEARAELEEIFATDCACSWIGFGERVDATGLDEQRAAWLELLKPWDIVHTEAERLIPVADKVVALTRQHSWRAGARKGVEVIGAAVYLVRDGRIGRADFYARLMEALDAVGLREHELPPEGRPVPELEALDPQGTAMFTLPGVDTGLWMLTQGGTPVGLIRRVGGGHSLRTASERWDAAIRRRGRVGWQVEVTRTGQLQPAIYYVPGGGLLEGGRLDVPSSTSRYRLRAPVIRNDWRLTGTTRGESVQIAFRRGGRVPPFKQHAQLDAELAHEPLLAGVILASSVAILVHFEQPHVNVSGG